jgi:threonine aldolase
MHDLRSDTVTRPTPAMLEFMMKAKVGDDVFSEDPTVRELEEKCADLFGMEAALYCPSGTMANQIAIKAHTQPGDEVICDRLSHIYNYEGGGIAFNSGASVRLLHGNQGCFTANEVLDNINNPDDIHSPQTTLVSVENTCNKGGGSIFELDEIKMIGEVCKQHQLNYHLDGARLFNALVAKNQSALDYHGVFDSISICISKGLGAPVGSVLIGSHDFIKQSKRVRKLFGGGMRQAGYLAAACIYALDKHVERLAEDHLLAQKIASVMMESPVVKSILPVETNIVIFELAEGINEAEVLEKLKSYGVLAFAFGKGKIRFVTHLDLNGEALLHDLSRFVKG